MLPGDIEAVLHIESLCYDFPWSRHLFEGCLRQDNYSLSVLEHQGSVKGYMVASQVHGEGQLLNICTHPDCQRLGYASKLLAQVVEHFRRRDVEQLLLEVRVSNTAAIALYKELAFKEVGHRKDYYPSKEGREDALVMSLSLD